MAAGTANDLVNLAFHRIGERADLTDYSTDQTARGKTVRPIYNLARRNLLTDAPWPWAVKRTVVLGTDTLQTPDVVTAYSPPHANGDYVSYDGLVWKSTTGSNNEVPGVGVHWVETLITTEWGYAYVLPATILAIECIAPTRQMRQDQLQPYAIENSGSGLVLLSDSDRMEIVTYRDVTDPAKWSEKFYDALAWAVAQDLAPALTARADLANRAVAMAAATLARAMRELDLTLRQTDNPPDSRIIAERT